MTWRGLMTHCAPRPLPDRATTNGRWGGWIGRGHGTDKSVRAHICPDWCFSPGQQRATYGVTCHPEAAAAPEGQSAPKDPHPETRTGRRNVDYSAAQPGYNLGVLRPSYAAQSLRDHAAPAAQDDSAICNGLLSIHSGLIWTDVV